SMPPIASTTTANPFGTTLYGLPVASRGLGLVYGEPMGTWTTAPPRPARGEPTRRGVVDDSVFLKTYDLTTRQTQTLLTYSSGMGRPIEVPAIGAYTFPQAPLGMNQFRTS